jgi:hypothetical protein
MENYYVNYVTMLENYLAKKLSSRDKKPGKVDTGEVTIAFHDQGAYTVTQGTTAWDVAEMIAKDHLKGFKLLSLPEQIVNVVDLHERITSARPIVGDLKLKIPTKPTKLPVLQANQEQKKLAIRI